MDASTIVMIAGFLLAGYSVVGNDVIQTLGTFLSSNEKRLKWYQLWLFAAAVLVAALTYGYLQGDVSYGRLAKFSLPEVFHWYYLIPPLVLLVITRFGIPVSTTFMILTLFALQDIPADFTEMVNSVFDFNNSKLGGMIKKSIIGYILAATVGLFFYLLVSGVTEKRFQKNPIKPKSRSFYFWTVAQWVTTGFLWFQWLTQDLANIYIFLGTDAGQLPLAGFILSCLALVSLLAFVFYQKGGKVQNVVRSKVNAVDIRSATFIDFLYATILYVFKYDSIFGLSYQFPWTGDMPMSTTWVFIGLLSGREIGVRIWNKNLNQKSIGVIFSDLGKVFFGLLISVVVVFLIKWLTQLTV